MKSHSSIRHRGFTLLEVLLATALLASGMAIAITAVTASTKAARRGEAVAEQTQRVRAVSGFLHRSIAGARPLVFGHDAATGLPRRFAGNGRTMSFVADLPGHFGVGGPHLHTLQLVDTPEGTELRIDFEVVVGGRSFPEQPARSPEVLVGGLHDAGFRYRSVDDSGHIGEWQDHWSREERLPLQVRIEATGKSGTVWPTIVISLPLAGAQR